MYGSAESQSIGFKRNCLLWDCNALSMEWNCSISWYISDNGMND